MAYWSDKLDRLPPNVCRLIAREPHRRKVPLTNERIAERGGYTVRKVREYSRCRTWADFTVREMERFKNACGITCGRECMETAYLRRTMDRSKVKSGLFHLRRLLRKSKDPRLERFLVGLMSP